MTQLTVDVIELDPVLVNRRQMLRLILGSQLGDLVVPMTPSQAKTLGKALLDYSREVGKVSREIKV
jgi:hypothetical protein